MHSIVCRVVCPWPGCDADATIVDRWTWDGSPSPVEHWATTCPNGHRYVGPVGV